MPKTMWERFVLAGRGFWNTGEVVVITLTTAGGCRDGGGGGNGEGIGGGGRDDLKVMEAGWLQELESDRYVIEKVM